MEFHEKVKIDMVCSEPFVEPCVQAILSSARTGEVFDPATGRVTKHVAFASPDDVDAAVTAASAAFAAWRSSSLTERTKIMFRFRELLSLRADDLAAIITAEHGKNLGDARGEAETIRGAVVHLPLRREGAQTSDVALASTASKAGARSRCAGITFDETPLARHLIEASMNLGASLATLNSEVCRAVTSGRRAWTKGVGHVAAPCLEMPSHPLSLFTREAAYART